jgi:hypothetical protein
MSRPCIRIMAMTFKPLAFACRREWEIFADRRYTTEPQPASQQRGPAKPDLPFFEASSFRT